jgi:hypothetical protein
MRSFRLTGHWQKFISRGLFLCWAEKINDLIMATSNDPIFLERQKIAFAKYLGVNPEMICDIRDTGEKESGFPVFQVTFKLTIHPDLQTFVKVWGD